MTYHNQCPIWRLKKLLITCFITCCIFIVGFHWRFPSTIRSEFVPPLKEPSLIGSAEVTSPRTDGRSTNLRSNPVSVVFESTLSSASLLPKLFLFFFFSTETELDFSFGFTTVRSSGFVGWGNDTSFPSSSFSAFDRVRLLRLAGFVTASVSGSFCSCPTAEVLDKLFRRCPLSETFSDKLSASRVLLREVALGFDSVLSFGRSGCSGSGAICDVLDWKRVSG